MDSKVRKSALDIKNASVAVGDVFAILHVVINNGNATTVRKQRNGRYAAGIVILVCISSIGARAQTPDQLTKLRLAQAYEQSGNYEKAAGYYSDLVHLDSTNAIYFDGLQRMYLQLKRYDDAIALMQRRLRVHPDDIALVATLGGAYYRAGDEKDAFATWDKAISMDPENQHVYRVVANMQLENRLLDRAAAMYRRARTALHDPTLFTLELSQLLTATMDYTGASQEYVRWLQKNPAQIAFVEGRMGTYTGKPEGRAAAIDVVRKELPDDANPRLYELLGWLYLEGKDFGQAREVYRQLDRLTNAHGSSIFAFAERAFNEGAYTEAAQAYQEAIDVPVTGPRLPAAKYGFASCMMRLSAQDDTLGHEQGMQYPESEAQPRYAGAIGYFRTIVAEYPHSEYAAKSNFQIGTIQYERFFDLDGALTSFGHVLEDVGAMPVLQYAVAMKIGEVYVAKGDTADAAQRFTLVLNAPNATPDLHDEAAYRVAELEFFGGHFTEAIDRLTAISLNMKADYANDALQLRTFLKENVSTSEDALREYAHAEFLARQHKTSEAITILDAVVGRFPKALLVDDALMTIGALETRSGRYAEAIASYQRLLTAFAESSIELDQAQFNIGRVYDLGLHDTANAVAAYEKLLAEYPESLLVTRARKRIRELRGDSL
jgi:tetratricopeptide (TPR) repeat protein